MAKARIFDKGLDLKSPVQAPLKSEFFGWIVDFARANEFRLKAGEVSFHLAREFGFCYGVDRAVKYAYEARTRFQDRNIYITGEIIHNPHVNRRLAEMGIRFLSGPYGSEEKFEPVTAEDVVILPAFGVSTEELRILKNKGSVLVDTTCGSVLNVWKNVERYACTGTTSIVHGKHWHEETKATVSRVLQFPGGHYLVLRDLEETRMVCSTIEHGGDPDAFMKLFSKAMSPGFNPQRHLGKIGLANQTTMLSSESLTIGTTLRETMIRRYGQAEISDRFHSFDTICSATQERQEAVMSLVQEGVDLMLVIGGYNSSNTTHLSEISSLHTPTYHVADSTCLVSAEEIRHKPIGREEVSSSNWLPPGPVVVGITTGASTPDIKVDEAIRRILSFRGLSLEELRPAGETT